MKHNNKEMTAQGLRIHSTNILMEYLRAVRPVQHWQLTEAVRCHMGDTYRGRERVSPMLPPFLAVVVR